MNLRLPLITYKLFWVLLAYRTTKSVIELYPFLFPCFSINFTAIASQICALFRQRGVSAGHILGAWEVNSKYDVITTDLRDGYLDTLVEVLSPIFSGSPFSFISLDLTNWHELNRFLSTLMALPPRCEGKRKFFFHFSPRGLKLIFDNKRELKYGMKI